MKLFSFFPSQCPFFIISVFLLLPSVLNPLPSIILASNFKRDDEGGTVVVLRFLSTSQSSFRVGGENRKNYHELSYKAGLPVEMRSRNLAITK
jgi:hypothetical protein